MASLVELLNNKDVTDDRKVIIDDVETTVGELRQGWLRQQDYTRKTTDLARQRDEFNKDRTEWEYARLEAESKLNELARQLIERNPNADERELKRQYDADPAVMKLNSELAEIKDALSIIAKTAKDSRDEVERLRMADYERQHRAVIDTLRKDDPKLDPEALISHAKNILTPRLDVAYRDMVFDDRMKEAFKKGRDEGMKEGREAAKTELAQPFIPTRRTFEPVGEDRPKTLDQALEAAMRDPEVMNTFRGSA